MMSRRNRIVDRAGTVIALAMILAACAAQSTARTLRDAPAPPAASEEPTPPPGLSPSAEPEAPRTTTTPSASAAEAQPSPPLSTAATADAPPARTLTELAEPERFLFLALQCGECGNGCRALGSIVHAAGRVCGRARSNAEARRCDDAKERVLSARRSINTMCGRCDGGPSVDPTAPIPSLR